MLCDTNIISELARPQPDPGVWQWAGTQTTMQLSAVTIDELYCGLSWKPNPRIRLWLDDFLGNYCTVLAVDERVAQYAGELRGNLQAQGKPRTQADILIAATATIHNLPLVTRNTKDFTDCGLELINPFS